ncbi:MAG TPA: hypothetical protein VMU05_04225 [Dongiaceae bacterium]|nr:hypothetical protein [Dongiaceae bacterium]
MAPRFALAVSVPLMLAACATVGPPRPPSLNLPQPPTDLRALRKGDRVTLTWTIPTMSTDREMMRTLGPTLICRGQGRLAACEQPVGETATSLPRTRIASAQKPQGSYTDTLLSHLLNDDPAASLTYAVEVLNSEKRGAGLSNQVHVSTVHTLLPPQDFHAQVTKNGVILSWTGSPVPIAPVRIRYVYRVYRHADGNGDQMLAGEVPLGAESTYTLVDSNIEWEKTYYYRAETVTEILRDNDRTDVEGDDTPEIRVFADDVFPPAVPTELQAVFSGPGQKPFIDLVWAPVSDADLAGYNVYRHEEGAAPVKVNGELIKVPAYRDTDVTSGKRYFYSVSAVDQRGNESVRSGEAGEAVPKESGSSEQ